MKTLTVWLLVLLVASAALGGCFGKKDDGDGGNGGNGGDGGNGGSSITNEDSALGNDGFQVTGGFAGTASPLKNSSAVQLDIIDVVDSDADVTEDSWDKARLILQTETSDGRRIDASLKAMALGSFLGPGQEFAGGVGLGIDVGGDSGRISNQLPKVKALFFAAGMASLKVNGESKPGNHLVFAFLTEGLRDDSTKAPLSAPDSGDLELHVYLPGNVIEGMAPIPDVPEGSLYYYFELVAASKMTDEQRNSVGVGLRPPERANDPPQPVTRFLVGGNAVSSGTKEGQENLTVTLDGSLSTDDGEIQVWVWRIAEPNATGILPEPGSSNITVVSGKTADVNFGKPGPKYIELVVRDDGGRTATLTSIFYVNYHVVLPFTSTTTQPAGAGTSCQDALNCNKHDIPFEFGFLNGTLTFNNAGAAAPRNVHISIHKPGNTNPSQDELKENEVNEPLTVDTTIVTEFGKRYRVYVWWEAGVSVSYNLDVSLNYAPALSAPAA